MLTIVFYQDITHNRLTYTLRLSCFGIKHTLFLLLPTALPSHHRQITPQQLPLTLNFPRLLPCLTHFPLSNRTLILIQQLIFHLIPLAFFLSQISIHSLMALNNLPALLELFAQNPNLLPLPLDKYPIFLSTNPVSTLYTYYSRPALLFPSQSPLFHPTFRSP